MGLMMGELGQIHPGLTGTAEMTVSEAHTAASMGSGKMPVLATPAVVALMEAAAQRAVEASLPPGQQSVGTRLAIRHDGATPVGMRVAAAAELTAISGRNLTFRVSVRDEKEVIAEGEHVRAVSSAAAFDRLLKQKMKRP